MRKNDNGSIATMISWRFRQIGYNSKRFVLSKNFVLTVDRGDNASDQIADLERKAYKKFEKLLLSLKN